MTSRRRTRSVPRREALDFIAKAERFLSAARHAQGNHDAVMLDAVHAGISAADAVCAALTGKNSAGSDHLAAADLLAQAGTPKEAFQAQASRLRRLVSVKTKVEYESAAASGSDARQALTSAERLVAWAREQVDAAAL